MKSGPNSACSCSSASQSSGCACASVSASASQLETKRTASPVVVSAAGSHVCRATSRRCSPPKPPWSSDTRSVYTPLPRRSCWFTSAAPCCRHSLPAVPTVVCLQLCLLAAYHDSHQHQQLRGVRGGLCQVPVCIQSALLRVFTALRSRIRSGCFHISIQSCHRVRDTPGLIERRCREERVVLSARNCQLNVVMVPNGAHWPVNKLGVALILVKAHAVRYLHIRGMEARRNWTGLSAHDTRFVRGQRHAVLVRVCTAART
jgi:hypothetical protein